jgi:hypothetical protein
MVQLEIIFRRIEDTPLGGGVGMNFAALSPLMSKTTSDAVSDALMSYADISRRLGSPVFETGHFVFDCRRIVSINNHIATEIQPEY